MAQSVFEKYLQMSPTGVIPLDGSVNFCEKPVVRGRDFDISL